MSISPIPKNETMVQNGLCTFRWVRWFDELVYGHVGDAATLDGQLPAYYATAAHTHTGVYAPAATFTAVAFDGANFGAETGGWTVIAANQITYAYSLNGKALTLLWEYESTTTSDPTAYLTLDIPGTALPAKNAHASHQYRTFTAGWDIGGVVVTAGVGTLKLYTRTQANWPAETNTLYTRGQIVLEVV